MLQINAQQYKYKIVFLVHLFENRVFMYILFVIR